MPASFRLARALHAARNSAKPGRRAPGRSAVSLPRLLAHGRAPVEFAMHVLRRDPVHEFLQGVLSLFERDDDQTSLLNGQFDAAAFLNSRNSSQCSSVCARPGCFPIFESSQSWSSPSHCLYAVYTMASVLSTTAGPPKKPPGQSLFPKPLPEAGLLLAPCVPQRRE